MSLSTLRRAMPIACLVAAVSVAPLRSDETATDNRAPSPNAVRANQADKLVYRAPGGIELELTADGLSAIRFGARTVASGGWSVFNAEGWFKDGGSGAVKTDPITEKSLEVLSPDHARVRHAGGDVVVVADYRFDGEDLTLSCRVENHHLEEPLRIVGFSGPMFEFDRPPEGWMMVQHISYFQAHGVRLCHPGHWSKIGGSWAADGSIGVGLSPWKTGWTRTLLLWDYGDWRPEARERSPRRKLLYFVVAPVPARGANTYDLRMRFSTRREWQHLMEPYREHFRATFGPCRYRPDYRWIASDYMNHSQQVVGPDNPYGFHGGFRRIDRREGVEAFCQTVIPALKSAGGQGVILWGQGGDDPRGAMYRPDFDVLPPEVEQLWPELARKFQEAGLKLGVCTRPADIAVRRDWRGDQIIQINADDPGHRDMLYRRFKTMIDRGCTLFYLDSFGSDLEHVKLMRDLRERIGPDVLTFAEHQCDAIFPYSGGYSETTFTAAKDGQPAGYHVWSGLGAWEIYRWLVPEAQLVARLYRVEGAIPEDFEPAEQFFYRNRITPLEPVSAFERAARLREIQPRYLAPDGTWR